MRAIRSVFLQMLVFMRRDMMLSAACLAPVLAGLGIRFGIPFLEAVLTERFSKSAVLSPYYALIDIFFSMLSPAMFCFISAMVSLEEADEKTAAYLFVTPLGRKGYLAARFCLPGAASFLVTAALLPVFGLSTRSLADILSLSAGGTLQGVIVALLIVTFSSNKLEGMAAAKLSSLLIFGAAVPFFLRQDAQYIMSPLPSFWIGKAVFEDTLVFMLPAFASSAVWIRFLLRRYLRKI